MTTTDTQTYPWTFDDATGQDLLAHCERAGLPTAGPLPVGGLIATGYFRPGRRDHWRLYLFAGLLARTHRALLAGWAERVCAAATRRLGALPADCAAALLDVREGDVRYAGDRAAWLLGRLAELHEVHVRRTGSRAEGDRAHAAIWNPGLRDFVAVLAECVEQPALLAA